MRRSHTPNGRIALIFSLLVGVASAAEDDSTTIESSVPFESTARLVFKTHCFHCHGESGVVEGGLDLRLRRLIVQGGDSGAAITPNDPSDSYLLDRMVDGEMPPEEVAIRPSAEEIEIVRRWIDAGATTARPEPENPNDLPRITPEERAFWAFRPIKSPETPDCDDMLGRSRLRTPIDAFILNRLGRQGRTFSENADKRILVRRAYFDLIGLPPTPEQVTAFVNDESGDAWSRLIDRLLNSPRYGERWGRHWLDVVGYADSEGFTEADTVRPFAYKYRDYVIEAFNTDMPFDKFIHEQLAGDELITSPFGELTDEDQKKLVATGFLRMAPDGTGSNPDDVVLARNAVVTETINIVSTSLMGMTVGCAQCHDHRFDPILHDDFYRMRAVFEPALNPKKWKTPDERRIPLAKPADRQRTSEIQKRADEAQAKYKEKESQCIEMVFRRELKKVPEEQRERARTAFHTTPSDRTDQQKKLLADYPNLRVSGGGALDLYLELFEEGREAKKELDQLKSKVARIRSELPQVDYIRGLTETSAQLPETFIFHRGDPGQPTERVGPGSLTVLDHLVEVQIAENDDSSKSSGRRLAFARHLTNPDHPLTTRVLVNRFWMHHFGRGLVETPGDFGTQGQRPTHPELLDWLARDFIDNGWSLKRLHKLIMSSTVYRQSSKRTDDFDPENRFYARQLVRRLEAETIRDAILSVSGSLSSNILGPAISVQRTSEGQIIVSNDVNAKIPSRRSIYVQTRRSAPLAMLEVFDAPRLEPNCTIRTFSTVTPQSLMLMNSEVVVQQARSFARRVASESGEAIEQQVDRTWEIAYGRAPKAAERHAALEFLRSQTDYFTNRNASKKKNGQAEEATSPAQQALSSLCMVLMGSNRFLYVE